MRFNAQLGNFTIVRFNAQAFSSTNMDNLMTIISARLKVLRKQRALSLDATSKKTGVSKAMLGQIERGESSPTIATLWKIANGLGVSFSSFVESQITQQSSCLHRTEVLQQIHQSDDKIRVMPLFPYDEKLGFEVFIIELLPGCTHVSSPHSEGVVEHVIPVRGTVEVLVGETWHSIKLHEGFRFDAHLTHGYRNLSQSEALFHNIIHYKPSVTLA